MQDFKTTLPEKIATYEEHIKTLKADLEKFENVNQIREDMFTRKSKLEDRTRELNRIQDSIKRELKETVADFKAKRSVLQQHSAYNGFSELETKVSQNEKLINNMKNYIASRS